MKKYLELQMIVYYFADEDIVTFSNGKDNDIKDDDNWFDD